MSSEKSAAKARVPRPPDQDLDQHYGAIGISAVAAAVHCHKRPPTSPEQDDAMEVPERSDRAA